MRKLQKIKKKNVPLWAKRKCKKTHPFYKMNKKCISISFVGVLSQPINLPMLSNDFCQGLFGNPSETFNGLTPEGYVIALNNKPMPMIVFNPQKFIFKASSLEELAKYIAVIK